MSLFANIQIDRMITHEIFARGTGNQEDPTPTFSTGITKLQGPAKTALEKRLGQVFGSNKYCLQLDVKEAEEESTFQMFAGCFDTDEAGFKSLSGELTSNLWKAQTTASIPGGVVVIATGKIGIAQKRFTCFIKAEQHAGFRKKSEKGILDLDYVSDLLLTDSQKWCKVAIVIENHVEDSSKSVKRDPFNFEVYAFDAQMKYQDSRIQTTYFVKTFLGCEVADTSKVQTKIFYDEVSNFIDAATLPDYEKVELGNALNAYLKSSEAVISVKDFAETAFSEPEKQDDFINLFKDSALPQHGIHKDTVLIDRQLQKRNLVFTNDVKIVGPSEQFGQLLEIVKDQSTDDFVIVKVYGKLKES